ncbi:proteasome assembly chaperone family protein [Natronorubrum halophilum]|uniref:proteasome assembly chaperone family protein n=1 Tax=Natronorubrum halophilum TaxID=1702106 RepID=UPI0010C23CAE|nr:PAC2 family protein [Natronorubrum halophilum]
MAPDVWYESTVSAPDRLTGTLFVALSNLGLAGVTALDHLTTTRSDEQIGRLRSRGMPGITPVEDGEPRHPMRVYASPETDAENDYCAVISELAIPVWAAEPFADAIQDLLGRSQADIDEVVVFHGIPIPHNPDEHEVYAVSTPEYRTRRLEESDTDPLRGGVLDGVPSELTLRGLDGEIPPVGTLVTPVHPPGPDLDAALRFLAFVRDVYGLDVDDEPLRERSAAMTQYYSELAERLGALEAADAPIGTQSWPEDRMYM